MKKANEYEICLERCTDIGQLAERWEKLQEKSSCSYFITWSWIGSLLKTLPANIVIQVLSIKKSGVDEALCLIGRKNTLRHNIINTKGLYINEVGDYFYDFITIEHNGMLCTSGEECEKMELMLNYAINDIEGWDELNISGVDSNNKISILLNNYSQLIFKSRRIEDYYTVNLIKQRREGRNYLDYLGSNTRYQIRRSLKLYENKYGPIQIYEAKTLEQAYKYFQELESLHQNYWNNKGEEGAFANKYFKKFHMQLISDSYTKDEIQLLKIEANNHIIGYLYNFVFNNYVYNYQSGFNYEVDNKYKPGIISHYLAVEYNKEKGRDIYDFMAGGGQYKRSLGTETGKMEWVTLQKKKLKYSIEEKLKKIKNTIF